MCFGALLLGLLLPPSPVCCSVAQSCLTLYDPADYSKPGFPEGAPLSFLEDEQRERDRPTPQHVPVCFPAEDCGMSEPR